MDTIATIFSEMFENESLPTIFYIHFLFLSTIFKKIVKKMAYNVPAVYDVFAVAISERGAFRQPQKCGWRLAWEWSAAE
jgi:hypothetical protein